MPGPLTADDLAEIRAAFTELLPSTCTLQTQSLSGGLSRGAWQDAATNVPCWLIDAGGRLPQLLASMLGAGTLKLEGGRRMIFSWGQAGVAPGNRALISGRSYAIREVKSDLDLLPCLIADVELQRVERAP